MSIKEVEKTVIFQSVCLRHLDFRELHIKLLLKGPQIGRYSAYPEVNFLAKCLAKESQSSYRLHSVHAAAVYCAKLATK